MEKKEPSDAELEALFNAIDRRKEEYNRRVDELDVSAKRRGMAPASERMGRYAPPARSADKERAANEKKGMDMFAKVEREQSQTIRTIKEGLGRMEKLVSDSQADPLEEKCDAVLGSVGGALRHTVREGVAGIKKAQRALDEEERSAAEDEQLQREGKLPPVE